MHIIEIEELSVNYGKVRALDNISLRIKDKEFLGIVGPNGGGKTTLLKVLLGLIKPSAGRIKIRAGSKIGYVPQFTNFNKSFPIKVIDAILMGKLSGKLVFFHKYSKNDINAAEKIMDDLGILQFKDRQIGQLSGGQMQKVLIARALIMEPEILLLDEPTASLDSNAKNDIYKLLKKLNSHKTIIIVSHDMGVVTSYVNSIVCLNKRLYSHGDNTQTSNRNILESSNCPVQLITHDTVHSRVINECKDDRI